MPNYDYACDVCGPFKAWRPMADSDLPAECPACAAPSSRLMSAPRLGASVGTGGAPAPAGSSPMRLHSGGCACCGPRPAPRVATPA